MLIFYNHWGAEKHYMAIHSSLAKEEILCVFLKVLKLNYFKI